MTYQNNYIGGFDNRDYRGGVGFVNNQKKVKRSGCKYKGSYFSKTDGAKVESPMLYGWNKSRKRGFISFVASPRKDKAKRVTASKDWENWSVKVQYDNGTGVKWFNGFYNVHTQKLIIPDLQMIANHNKDYFGTLHKK